jgi:hypothetical protein
MEYHHAAVAMLGQAKHERSFRPDAGAERERTIPLASPPLRTRHALGFEEERSPGRP